MIGKGRGSESEVFGDAAHMAARVQSAADPDTVIATPSVNRLVSGLFVIEEHGAHQVKGVVEPVKLYRIIRLSSARNLELMQLLIEQTATARVMLVCTTRPEFRAPWLPRAHYRQLILNRLNTRAVRELVASVVAQPCSPSRRLKGGRAH